MADFLRPNEVPAFRKLAVLGDKTMAENFADFDARWAKGEGAPDLPYGPRYAGHWPPGWRLGDAKRVMPIRDERAELEAHFTRVGLPIRLADVLRAGVTECLAVKRVRDWHASASSLLLLHGDPGGGKSVAAASAFMLQKRKHWTGVGVEWNSLGAFIDAADLASDIFSDETKELLAYLGESDLVVLDELGAEVDSNPWRSALDNLINTRFSNPKLRTIIATNVSAKRPSHDKPSPFEVRYGSRIARRVREDGLVYCVTKDELREPGEDG